MQMRKIYCFRSFALRSAHVKCGVSNGPKFPTKKKKHKIYVTQPRFSVSLGWDGKSFFELHSVYKDEVRHLVYFLANAAVFNEGGSRPPASRTLLSHFPNLYIPAPALFSPAPVPYKLGDAKHILVI